MTRDDLIIHIHRTAGQIASMFGWDPDSGSYDLVMDRILAEIGSEDIESVGDIPMLTAVAEMELWRFAMEQTVGFHSISTADGERRDREAIHRQIIEQFNRSEIRVQQIRWGSDVQITYRDQSITSPYLRRRNQIPRGSVWWDKR